jgi:hypothetical protein
VLRRGRAGRKARQAPRLHVFARRVPVNRCYTGEMAADDAEAPKSTSEQYRERARVIRREAETMGGPIRRQLLVIADQYDLLADSME